MAYDECLAERVRAGLSAVTWREVKMFGGLSFLVEEKMVVSVRGRGGLLVRCDPDQVEELLGRDGATRAEMRGRPMKEGWLHVDDAGLDDDGIARWLEAALVYNRTLG